MVFGAIVAGTDGSPTARVAVDHAVELARLTSSHLHLVTALKARDAPLAHAAAHSRLTLEEEDEARGEAIALLTRLAKEAETTGVRVSTHWRARRPADALIEVAEQEGASLIVVGNKRMQGASRVLGSVPNAVCHNARCSVLIVATTS